MWTATSTFLRNSPFVGNASMEPIGPWTHLVHPGMLRRCKVTGHAGHGMCHQHVSCVFCCKKTTGDTRHRLFDSCHAAKPLDFGVLYPLKGKHRLCLMLDLGSWWVLAPQWAQWTVRNQGGLSCLPVTVADRPTGKGDLTDAHALYVYIYIYTYVCVQHNDKDMKVY